MDGADFLLNVASAPRSGSGTLASDSVRMLSRNFVKLVPPFQLSDAVRFNVGMGFSLNERSSFSLSYSLDLYDETRIELASAPKIAGSDVTIGKFLIGYSLNLGNGQPFNLAIGIGATDDAPDTDITFRMPFNFLK